MEQPTPKNPRPCLPRKRVSNRLGMNASASWLLQVLAVRGSRSHKRGGFIKSRLPCQGGEGDCAAAAEGSLFLTCELQTRRNSSGVHSLKVPGCLFFIQGMSSPRRWSPRCKRSNVLPNKLQSLFPGRQNRVNPVLSLLLWSLWGE